MNFQKPRQLNWQRNSILIIGMVIGAPDMVDTITMDGGGQWRRQWCATMVLSQAIGFSMWAVERDFCSTTLCRLCQELRLQGSTYLTMLFKTPKKKCGHI